MTLADALRKCATLKFSHVTLIFDWGSQTYTRVFLNDLQSCLMDAPVRFIYFEPDKFNIILRLEEPK